MRKDTVGRYLIPSSGSEGALLRASPECSSRSSEQVWLRSSEGMVLRWSDAGEGSERFPQWRNPFGLSGGFLMPEEISPFHRPWSGV